MQYLGCVAVKFLQNFKHSPHSLGENFVIHHRRREAHGVGRIV